MTEPAKPCYREANGDMRLAIRLLTTASIANTLAIVVLAVALVVTR